jgi:diguanylate cyclase (GGDEF)-like protein/PAS domain S-box-containing protein
MIKNESDPFFSILHTLPEIVYEIDTEGHFIYLNNAIEKLGYSAGELLGRHFTELVHPDDLPTVQRASVLPRLAGQNIGHDKSPGLFDERRCGMRLTRNLKVRFVSKPDSSIPVMDGEVAAIGLYNHEKPDNRQFIGTLGIIRDISYRKRTQQAILRTEKHYRLLLENSSDLISIITHDGTILFASESFRKLMKRDPIDLIGDNIYAYIHEEDRGRVADILEERTTDPLLNETFRYLNSDNQWRTLKSAIRKISNSRNDTICFVTNSNDITEQRLAEQVIVDTAKRYRAIAERSSEVVIVTNGEGIVEDISQSIKRILGHLPMKMIGKNLLDFLHPGDRGRLREAFQTASGLYSTGEYRFRDEKKIWRIVEISVNNELDVAPINSIIINMRDMTEVRKAERSLINSEKKYRTLYDNALVAIISIHWEGGNILACNKLGHELFGFDSKYDLIGEMFLESIIDDHARESFTRTITMEGEITNMEMLLKKKDGRELWVNLTGKLDREEETAGLALIDITKKKETEDQLFRLTFYDPLTGLPNSALFKKRLYIEILKSQQFALMCMGVRNFKDINEMYGMETGDQLLKEIGAKLSSEYFKKDLVVRFAGDKFMVLLSGIGDTGDKYSMDNIDTIAHKTRNILSQPFNVKNNSINIVTSIGISFYPHDGDTPEVLMHNAESAMYMARARGSDGFHYFDADINSHMMKRLTLEKDMRQAIESREFFLHFQPKFDRVGNIAGMEALIRWYHEGHGRLIPPTEFIPIAEKSRLISPIGLIALEEACVRNRLLQKKGFAPMRIAVNLSPYQFTQRDLIPQIIDTVNKSGLKFEWLELEITESGISENEKESIRKLNELHDMGITISIDDFGTGYSSLSKLKDYPIDTLKIDRTFIVDLLKDRVSSTLVKTIIDLAHNMGFKVIAEGVETEEQFEFLKGMECDFFQGYYFSRPLDFDDFMNILSKK